MFDVLIYLFENYLLDTPSFDSGQDELAKELIGAGFLKEEVDKAFSWLDDLMEVCENQYDTKKQGQTQFSVRFYTEEENKHLTMPGRSLLNRLVDTGVLDQFSREMVIDRIMAIQEGKIELEHIKWVVLMVVSNRADFGDIADWAEWAISENGSLMLH